MKLGIMAVAGFVFMWLFAGAAAADQRSYVWTYEYLTLSKDHAELEYYQTAVTKDRQSDNSSDWQQQLELEYGLTDHLDAALYQVFDQKENDKMKYSGYKFRLRYRIAEKDVLPLDVLLYVEHQEKVDGKNVFEGKLILAKDIGKVNFAYNQIYKNTYASGDSADHEYAAGVSYEVTPAVRVGVESKGNYRTDKYSAGPTIAWIGGRIWANLGAVYGLNRRTDDRQVRFLLGVPF
ncbi:MAG: hypothetical protein A2010_17570 [Nitrospirae bacterium GWD2_57_9]|nr:MAG: hypothetical protein A2010_17570 [Nitrospirae bacterium GWD2_57_9]OGW45426.1 MAG: hypothetical protein A2078_16625 [Nitrospirae bacterium GWC2_57_9]